MSIETIPVRFVFVSVTRLEKGILYVVKYLDFIHVRKSFLVKIGQVFK